MYKRRSFGAVLLRTVLIILAWEAVLLTLSWLLYQHQTHWHRYRFSNILFIIGALEMMIASLGMMNRTYEVPNSPYGVWASPVQDSEQEKRYIMIANIIEQKAFGIRLAAIGLLTILLGVGLSYLTIY